MKVSELTPEQELRWEQWRDVMVRESNLRKAGSRPACNRAGHAAAAGSPARLNRTLALAVGLAVLLALSAAASACGVGMGDMAAMHAEMHGGGLKVAQTPIASSASAVTVEIRNYDFFPRDLTVQRGASVTWVNRDNAPHNATDANRSWGTATLGPGDTATIAFDTPGVYEYVCAIHPNMEAKLTVA